MNEETHKALAATARAHLGAAWACLKELTDAGCVVRLRFDPRGSINEPPPGPVVTVNNTKRFEIEVQKTESY